MTSCPLGKDCDYCCFSLVKETEEEGVIKQICTYGMDEDEVRRLQYEEGYQPCG